MRARFAQPGVWFAAAVAFYFLTSASAYAYIDPGTGSYVLQMVIALLLGAAYAIRVFWTRLVAGAKRLFGKGGKEEEDDSKP